MASSNMFDLSGRTAVVTGGGTHLGKAMAEALIDFGADVHIAGRRWEVCQATAKELADNGRPCTPHQCDAADEASVRALIAKATERSGRLDVMVANAGGASDGPQVPDISMQRWETTLRTSVTTAFVSAQEAAKNMAGHDGGSIVLLGSIFGSLGANPALYGPDWPRACSDYNAAKGAVLALATSMACELGSQGVRVNCISPGQIPPPGSDEVTVENFRQANPLARTGLPQDIKGITVLLASDASSWITGQNFVVDGGWSAW